MALLEVYAAWECHVSLFPLYLIPTRKTAIHARSFVSIWQFHSLHLRLKTDQRRLL